MDIFKEIFDFSTHAGAKAAIIAAIISAIISYITTKAIIKSDKDARHFQRADWLLKNVYNPILSSVKVKKSDEGKLYAYMRIRNENTLELDNYNFLKDNLHEFPKRIMVLIIKALNVFYFDKMTFGGLSKDEEVKKRESEIEMQEIEDKLIPRLEQEFIRLKGIVDKGI